MGEIVQLPSHERLCWQCACGCTTHYMMQDGAVECAMCGEVQHRCGGWTPPREIDEPSEARSTSDVVVNLDDPHIAVRRTLSTDPEDMKVLIVVGADGRVSVWGDVFETRAQRGWLRRRLEDARQLLIARTKGLG